MQRRAQPKTLVLGPGHRVVTVLQFVQGGAQVEQQIDDVGDVGLVPVDYEMKQLAALDAAASVEQQAEGW